MDDGMDTCAVSFVNGLLEVAIMDFTSENACEDPFSCDAMRIFPVPEPPIPEGDEEDADLEDGEEDGEEDEYVFGIDCESLCAEPGTDCGTLSLCTDFQDAEKHDQSGIDFSLDSPCADKYLSEDDLDGSITEIAGSERGDLLTVSVSGSDFDSDSDPEYDADITSVVSLISHEDQELLEEHEEVARQLVDGIVCSRLPFSDFWNMACTEVCRDMLHNERDHVLPMASSLPLCERRSFRRDLHPITPGPPVAEELFPLDCLPLSPPVAPITAPCVDMNGPSIRLQQDSSAIIQLRWRQHRAKRRFQEAAAKLFAKAVEGRSNGASLSAPEPQAETLQPRPPPGPRHGDGPRRCVRPAPHTVAPPEAAATFGNESQVTSTIVRAPAPPKTPHTARYPRRASRSGARPTEETPAPPKISATPPQTPRPVWQNATPNRTCTPRKNTAVPAFRMDLSDAPSDTPTAPSAPSRASSLVKGYQALGVEMFCLDAGDNSLPASRPTPRGISSFGKGPVDFTKGPVDFSKGPMDFSKGPMDFRSTVAQAYGRRGGSHPPAWTGITLKGFGDQEPAPSTNMQSAMEMDLGVCSQTPRTPRAGTTRLLPSLPKVTKSLQSTTGSMNVVMGKKSMTCTPRAIDGVS